MDEWLPKYDSIESGNDRNSKENKAGSFDIISLTSHVFI